MIKSKPRKKVSKISTKKTRFKINPKNDLKQKTEIVINEIRSLLDLLEQRNEEATKFQYSNEMISEDDFNNLQKIRNSLLDFA